MASEDDTFRKLKKWPARDMFEEVVKVYPAWALGGQRLSERGLLAVEKCGWTEEEFLIELKK
jgi:hypothetical protein